MSKRRRQGPKKPAKPSRTRRSSPAGFTDRSGKVHSFRGHRDREALKLTATVDKTKSGAGFLIFDKKDFEDLYVPPRHADSLFHGDRVEVLADHRGHLIDLKVIQHRFVEMVGKYAPHFSSKAEPGSGWLIYESRKFKEQVYLPQVPATARVGDYLRVKVIHKDKGPHKLVGEVIEVFGPMIPAAHDIPMVAAEFALIEKHSAAAEKEAESKTLEIPGRDLEGRTDLRHLPFITIDGETARDFDDAVYVERKGSDYILWVAIADVSHYVVEGTALNDDAYARATSVYFPERAFHMLPRALSENLCSLRPKEPRLAMACSIRIDSRGQFKETKLFDAVIESRRRATYNDIEKERIDNEGDPHWEYAPHIELYRILRATRTARGSIDFELPEYEIRVDEHGEPTTIQRRPRLDSHRLIEEFMIAANEAVTRWIRERDLPFIYRVHEEPTLEAVRRFTELAKSVGFPIVPPERGAEPRDFALIVEKLQGHPAETLLNMTLLRSMKQAVYSADYGGHFGLASDAYTHFTSPIRRYPDLIVHRMLRRALRIDQGKEPRLTDKQKDSLYKKLSEMTEHCSYRERLAAEAEREANRLKQVRMMTKHLGEDFDASVNGMNERGLFAQIKDPFVEGFIPKDVMDDDFYEFREDKMVFVGKRRRKVYKIGDPIRVQVIRTDLDRRQIELKPIDYRHGTPQNDEAARSSR